MYNPEAIAYCRQNKSPIHAIFSYFFHLIMYNGAQTTNSVVIVINAHNEWS